MLIYNKDDIEFVTEFPCLSGHPVHCLFVCLSVCIQKTSKRLNRSGPNFVWDLTWSRGPREGLWIIKISKICLPPWPLKILQRGGGLFVRSHTKFGPICLAVLTFIGYKRTDKQTSNVQGVPINMGIQWQIYMPNMILLTGLLHCEKRLPIPKQKYSP